MSKYLVLPPHLHKVADAAETLIKLKLGLKDTQIEKPIDSSIGLEPTLHWKTNLGYVICEVAERPQPVSVSTAYQDIVSSGLPVKVIVAFPASLSISPADYIKESNKAKKSGLGLLSINDDDTGDFQHRGIDISLYLAEPSLTQFNKLLRAGIESAYGVYINGDPVQGVQAIGQMVEQILGNLAEQAKKSGKLTSGRFVSKDKFYSFASLVDDFTKDKILDNAILGRCRGFVEDRNKTSHKPTSLAKAKKLHQDLKNAWLGGLRILAELPDALKAKGYKFKL
ncbi:MAG TPA: hypothetical protein VGM63_24870 [Mucilaginibacter sp.]|jgi:hypothetical protein